MARFLSSLGAALQIAANDQASPEAGLLEGKANSQFQRLLMVTDHPKFASGNVNTKTPNGEKGWILGHFIDASSPFHNMGFEIKWSNFRKGDKKPEPALNVKAKSVVILVYGSFRIDFPDEKKSFTLRDEGDYVFFNAGVTHSWEVLEDSLLITIRWPSTPNDQKPA